MVRLQSLATYHRSDDGTGLKIRGRAAVFFNRRNSAGTQFQVIEGIYERINRRAFDRSLKDGDDVACLANHDPNAIIARTSARSLALRTDYYGLLFDADIGENAAGAELRSNIKTGLIHACSFGFVIRDDQWFMDGNDAVREIMDVKLHEVSCVSFPAYTATTCHVRGNPHGLDEFYEKLAAMRSGCLAKG